MVIHQRIDACINLLLICLPICTSAFTTVECLGEKIAHALNYVFQSLCSNI